MALDEPIVVPAGYRLFRGGLGAETVRDPCCTRHWLGVSAEEVALLERWVRKVGEELEELHTDVAVGMIPDTSGADVPGWLDRMCCSSHPLRIDAVAKVAGRWLVLEVKGQAGYQALGQVLTYGYYVHLASEELEGARLCVVTDAMQECIRPVYERFNVQVFEVG